MRVKVAFFIEHGVHGIEDLVRGGNDDGGVDLGGHAGLNDEQCVEKCQSNHGASEGLQLEVGPEQGGVQLAAVEEVDQRVASVSLGGEACRVCPMGKGERDNCLAVREEDGGAHEVEVLRSDLPQIDPVVGEGGHQGQHQQQGLESVHPVPLNLETTFNFREMQQAM